MPEAGEEAARNETSASSGPALLESGPVRRYGILILPANAIGHYQGVYEDGEFSITVRYTEEDIVVPSDWVTRRCGDDAVWFITDDQIIHYLYGSGDGWYTFFEFPRDYGEECVFIQRFLQRLRYFKSVAESPDSVPLPAIVETP